MSVLRRVSSGRGHVGGEDDIRARTLTEFWRITNQSAKLTKKQLDINIAERIALLISMGSDSSSVHLDFVFGTFAACSTVLKGVCVIYARQMDTLVRDCEFLLFRKFVSAIRTDMSSTLQGVPTASRASIRSSRRSSLVSSRRSSLVSLAPCDPLDLMSICDELSREMAPLPRASPIVPGKRSRSGSSVSSDDAGTGMVFDAVTEDDAGFVDIASIIEGMAAEEPAARVRGTRNGPPKRLRGFDGKVAYTTLQWARILRESESKLTDVSTRTAMYYAQQPDVGEETDVHIHPGDDEIVSVGPPAEYEDYDELRAVSVVDPFENLGMRDRITLASRPSLASTLHRESISSDVFGSSRPLRLKELLRSELLERGRRTDTMVRFIDICELRNTTRKTAADTFQNLLTLTSIGDMRIENSRKVSFDNTALMFSLRRSGSSSASSSSSDN
jgi:hypothetical protein